MADRKNEQQMLAELTGYDSSLSPDEMINKYLGQPSTMRTWQENINIINNYSSTDRSIREIMQSNLTTDLSLDTNIEYSVQEMLEKIQAAGLDIGNALWSGVTYFIDAAAADDTGTGLTPATAWKTTTKVSTALGDGTIHAGDNILFKRGGTYAGIVTVAMSGTAGLPVKFNAYGTGANPIIDATGQVRGFNLAGRSYISIKNIDVTGATTSAFNITTGNSNILVYNSTATASAIGASISGGVLSNITLNRCNFSGMNRGASIGTVTSLDNFNLIDCTFDSNVQYGILGLPAVLVTNVNISGSSFSGGTAKGFDWTLADGMIITNSTASNNAAGTSNYGFRFLGCKNVTLDGVTANANGGDNILFNVSGANLPTGITLKNITANSSGGGNGIHVILSDTLVMQNCTIDTEKLAGMKLEGCTNVTMTDINSYNPQQDAIYIVNSTTVRSTDITLTNARLINASRDPSIAYNGITLFGNGDRFTGKNIYISDSNGDGFNIHGTWSDVVFDGCTAYNNGVTGATSDGDGFSFHDNTSGTIKNCISYNNKKSAIAHVGNACVQHYNNLFYHATNGTIALCYIGETGTYTFFNNTIYSPSQVGNGVNFATGNTATVTMKNNIIQGFNYGIVESGAATLDENYNTIYGYATDAVSGFAAGANDLTTDPSLVGSPAQVAVDIVNPGFEIAGAGDPDFFGGWSENAGTGAIANETTAFHGGAHSAKLTAGATFDTYLYQSFTVTSGQAYKYSFWTRGDGTYDGACAFYDVTNSAYVTGTIRTGVTGTTYALSSGSFVAPAGCTSIRIYLKCSSTNTGIAYFDDISIVEVPVTLPDNMALTAGSPAINSGTSSELIGVTVVNPGFEIAGAGGADLFSGWTEATGDGAIAATTTAGEFHAGATAVKLTAGATKNTAVAYNLTVVPGQTYNFSFFTRGDGTYAGRYNIYDISNSADIIAATTTGVTGTTYTLVSNSFTAPTNCITAQIVFYCATTAAGIAYFDDVSIFQVTGITTDYYDNPRVGAYDRGAIENQG